MPSELSLVKIARLLVIYWIASWIVAPVYCYLTTGDKFGLTPLQIGFIVAIELLVLGMLFSQFLQQRLGSYFLPLVIGLCSVPFFLERIWLLQYGGGPDASPFDMLRGFAIRQDFILLALLIGWQYRFRYAVIYVAIISFSDWGLTILITHQIESPLATMLPALVGRATIFLMAAYVLSWLRQLQQHQQQALVEAHEQQVRANRDLARYAASIEQLSISRERNRLARELHDTLAHSLSAISLQLEAVSSLWGVDVAAARKMLGRADETTRTGLTEARRALQALRAAPLEQFGLSLALRDIAESAAKRADLSLELEVPDLAVNLPSYAEQAIYRIAQEALENIVRHARATQAKVKLLCNAAELELLIVDDGIGFSLERLRGAVNHWGISGMRERAAVLGSDLRIQSEQNKGTQISVCLRLDELWKSESAS
jgi:signal transduction histidine kinase